MFAMTRHGKSQATAESPTIAQKEELYLRTRLEELLRDARQEFLRSGEPMLDWDGLEREVAGRRGGVGDEL